MSEKRLVLERKEKHAKDLYLTSCGHENCEPGYSYGPAVRPYYTLHFVLEGKGVFYINNQQYVLGRNQCFLIPPDVLTFYQADAAAPWTYTWICFNGDLAATYLNRIGLHSTSPVGRILDIAPVQQTILDMMEHHQLDPADELYIQSWLYRILAHLTKESNISYSDIDTADNFYVKKAIDYIQNNYFHSIKVTDVAEYLAVNRSYLFTLFKKHLHMSPQQFLTVTKISNAQELLINSDLSIGDVARSCGYTDTYAFSTAFKRIVHKTPRDYRKDHQIDGTLHAE